MADWRVLITMPSNTIKYVIVEDCIYLKDAIAEAESRTGGKCKNNSAFPISKDEKEHLLGKTKGADSKGACFVATVAYGNTNHPDVAFLRFYRDSVLVKSKFGRRFIDWYYRRGPQIATVVARSRLLRKASRHLLSATIKMLNIISHKGH